MDFIDTHTHIFIDDFDVDRQSAIDRAKKVGVKCMILPNIDSSSIEQLLNVADQYKGYCLPLMGLHPTSVKDSFEQELDLVEDQLRKNQFWGIGEIGIDLYWDKTFFEQQKIAFRHQLKLAKKFKLPVVIHSRNAFDEILEIVDQEIDESLKGVFHSFSGSLSNYQQIMSYKTFMVGIGGVVTYKNGRVDKVLKDMNIQNVLLETDSPYLSPIPLRGKRNESANIVHVAHKVAEILNLSVEDVAQATTQNAINIFSLDL